MPNSDPTSTTYAFAAPLVPRRGSRAAASTLAIRHSRTSAGAARDAWYRSVRSGLKSPIAFPLSDIGLACMLHSLYRVSCVQHYQRVVIHATPCYAGAMERSETLRGAISAGVLALRNEFGCSQDELASEM